MIKSENKQYKNTISKSKTHSTADVYLSTVNSTLALMVGICKIYNFKENFILIDPCLYSYLQKDIHEKYYFRNVFTVD
jgi:hypothetical protein